MAMHPFENRVGGAIREAGLSLRLRDDSGDRHGAWEWSFVGSNPADPRTHWYVFIAAIPVDQIKQTLEVWAGADDSTRFGRALVGKIAHVDPAMDYYLPELTSLIQKAETAAKSFPKDEMKILYDFASDSVS